MEPWSITKCVCQVPVVCDKWWLHFTRYLLRSVCRPLIGQPLHFCPLIGQLRPMSPSHVTPRVFMLC